MIDFFPDNIIESQLANCRTLYLGFSGGLDSTVLLHALAQQERVHHKVIAVHINHGVSPHALEWEEHCCRFAARYSIPCIVKRLELKPGANFENTARKARYAYFQTLLQPMDCLLLAHHRDDQAETVLLNLFRGAGVEGLSAMPESRTCGQARLFRPLLNYSRRELEDYARNENLLWVEDESNIETHYSRNFLRQELIPQLCSRWPGVINNLLRTSLHCQQSQQLQDDLALIDCPQLTVPGKHLDCAALRNYPRHRLENIFRFWLKKNHCVMPDTLTFNRIIDELLFARPDAMPQVCWGKYTIKRYRNSLFLLNQTTQKNSDVAWIHFPEPLHLAQGTLCVRPTLAGIHIEPENTLDIRFRSGGELFHWHQQNKPLKKLFQQWQIPVWLRDQIPLLYIDGYLAAVVGYAVSDLFYRTIGTHNYELVLDGNLHC